MLLLGGPSSSGNMAMLEASIILFRVDGLM